MIRVGDADYLRWGQASFEGLSLGSRGFFVTGVQRCLG
jgi:hypothetical protein